MNNHFHSVILGAGPAGLSTALTLAGFGERVMLVEKSPWPREKICGGFIGPENRPLLESWGLWEDLVPMKQAQRIRRILLTAGKNTACEIPMKLKQRDVTGLGILRKDFDAALATRAELAGVVFSPASSYELLETHPDTRLLITDFQSGAKREISCEHLIDARGSQAARGYEQKPASFGVAATFRGVQGMDDCVVLHFMKRAHVGLNRVGPDLYNFCYVVEKGLLDQVQGNLSRLFDHFKNENHILRGQVESAVQVTPWKGIPVSAQRKATFDAQGLFAVGDHCAIVNPVIGGGITLALWGGFMLGYALTHAHSKEAALALYQKMWRDEFEQKTRLSFFWGKISHTRFLAEWLLKGLRSHVALAGKIFEHHHSIDHPLCLPNTTIKEYLLHANQ